ncbi:hypothetical protein AT05_08080 [Schleiferia thermophila str. Yellowstone]|nr:hypothetical protein AT05_08080 [Schleiferia thermophila str. Yellowstone]
MFDFFSPELFPRPVAGFFFYQKFADVILRLMENRQV